MATDNELLQHYADEGSESAFAELVRGRIALVHGVAMRRVGGDVHLANDVTQQVFIALARGAARLKGHPVLSGWLHTSTRQIAAQTVRTARRRTAREQGASHMHEIDSTTELTPDWDKLRGHLDEAMDRLGKRDRDALSLRFFEDSSFSDIGQRLHLSENAARMRVERALNKMQGLLSERGITSTAAAIGTTLAASTAQALPAGFSATVTSTAIASVGLAGAIPGIIFMSITKLQLGIAITLIAAGVGGFLVQQNANAHLKAQLNGFSRQGEEVTQLKAENSRLKQALVQAAQSPASAEARTASASTAPRYPDISQANHRELPALAPGLTPIDGLDHSGRTTPRTAFSTQIWAAAQGDVDLEQSAIALSPEGRAKLAALIATLPPAAQANYGTPERLMASVLAGSPHPVGGIQVLGETTQSPDEVTLQTAWQHADDSIVHHSSVELQQDGTGWRMVVPMILVDRAVSYITRNTDTGAAQAGKK
jgi:RNA polymerase sigma factor (sigma-70 family)